MSSSSTINGGDTGRRPEFKVDAYSLQSEKQSRRIGDNAPVQVRYGPLKFYSGLFIYDFFSLYRVQWGNDEIAAEDPGGVKRREK